MAEFIFKDMVRKAGLEEVRIDSAAVSYEEEGTTSILRRNGRCMGTESLSGGIVPTG